MLPFASSAAVMSETHAGETLDQAKSSCKVHCTRTGFPVNCDKNHGVGLGAISAKGRAAILPGLIHPPHHYFFTGMPSMYAIRARNPCNCAECVQIVTLPSLLTSATATKGPIGACRT